jgi:ComF family protein
MCAQQICLPGRVCDCIRLNRDGPPSWDAAHAAVDYAHPWIELIADFKYRGQVERADLLARLAHQALPTDARFDGVSPIPLSDGRLRERGYNQTWELARRVAQWLPEQPRARPDLLLRADTPTHQARLGRDERLHNLDGTLMVNPRRLHEVRGSRVLLVDDVMTTGATFQIASRALKRAGALSVVVLAVARTA